MSNVRPKHTGGGKPFPSPNMETGTAKAEPTLIGRQDIEHGVWSVEDCRAVRGEPSTDLSNRVMFAPSTDDELARAIRAHELMHSKVSPTNEQFDAFIARGIASETAMRVVEELRVNYLCETAGLPVKQHLQDGAELALGERLASTGDWAGAVAMTIATTNTNGLKPFLNGIRRHNRAWGESLLTISKRAMREIKKSHKQGTLARTQEYEGVEPYGFLHTERIAEWVDRLASFPPPPRPPKGKSGSGAEGDAGLLGDNVGGEKSHSNKGENGEKEGDKSGNPHTGITPSEHGGASRWADLRVERVPMPKVLHGAIGKKRIATNMGRRPRRLHRLMTDPAKRVFDRTTRGSGGMVIIDASGSMSFTESQIAEIIAHAPGCTVAIYSDRNKQDGANFWVVADKGRMVETLSGIPYGHGNGVDYPAIVWGVENRKHKNAPLVWVTDGGVCGYNDGYSDLLAIQCLTYAMKNRYIIVPHIEEAISQLSKLANGGDARSVYPPMFRQVWHDRMRGLPMP